MLSIALPHPWEDEGELVLHLLEECNSADRVEWFGKVQGDQYQSGWSLRRFLFHVLCSLSTSWHTHSKLHRGECTRELFLEVAHDGRADELMEDGPYGNGPYSTIFLLGYGNQPSTKEVWSEVLWDELWWLAAILLHSLQM